MTARVRDRSDARRLAESLQKRTDMVARRLGLDPERVGDLLRRRSLAEKPEDVVLPRREARLLRRRELRLELARRRDDAEDADELAAIVQRDRVDLGRYASPLLVEHRARELHGAGAELLCREHLLGRLARLRRVELLDGDAVFEEIRQLSARRRAETRK